MSASRTAVFDCNVFLQLMINPRGAAHGCWESVLSGEVQLFVSEFVIGEIRALPHHPRLRRFRQITEEKVGEFIAELLSIAVLVDEPPALFELPRDPDDAHYVNLAIATGSMLVVSNDRDLLDLMEDTNDTGIVLRIRYPKFRVLTPSAFLQELKPPSRRE